MSGPSQGALGLAAAEKPREAPRITCGDDPERMCDGLDSLICFDQFRPFDMHKVIERIADEGGFFELQKDHARNVIMRAELRKYINRSLDMLEDKRVAWLPRKYSNINL